MWEYFTFYVSVIPWQRVTEISTDIHNLYCLLCTVLSVWVRDRQTLWKSIEHIMAFFLIQLEIRARYDCETLFSLTNSSHSGEDHLYPNKTWDIFSSLSKSLPIRQMYPNSSFQNLFRKRFTSCLKDSNRGLTESPSIRLCNSS